MAPPQRLPRPAARVGSRSDPNRDTGAAVPAVDRGRAGTGSAAVHLWQRYRGRKLYDQY
jgi:hypothetical protein